MSETTNPPVVARPSRANQGLFNDVFETVRSLLPRLDNRQRRLVIDSTLMGVAGAAAAQVFTVLLKASTHLFLGVLAGYRAPGLASEGGTPTEVIGPHGLWLIPVATTLGGLITGIIITRLAPEAEGHGTDTVVRAFHRAGGALRARVTPVKMIASAITIGSGGAAGREGPIALIAAGVGSWYGEFTERDEEDRRFLLLAGAAAGISAIFRSPIGAALFLVEVLYADMEFEAGVLLHITLATIVAYAVNGFFSGWEPLFVMPSMTDALRSPLNYGWYAILGIASGIFATALPVAFYGIRDLFRALPVKEYLKPAIGGLLTGLVALALPQIIDGGYGWVQSAINGNLTIGLLLLLAVAKMFTMSFTVSSGGSGGVFAPSLFCGAMLGGACAAVAHQPPAPFVVVGMAAVFAGAAHVPFATMMMVTEMTGGYSLLVPAALAVMLSYLVQAAAARNLRYRTLYEAQVQSRGDSPAHHTQHLEIALRLLREHAVTNLDHVGEVDLISLLRSGIPVELGEGRRLFVGALRPESAFVGKTIADSAQSVAWGDTTVFAILRGQHMMGPRQDLVLCAGDRLIVVADSQALERLRGDLAAW
ncbi:MAG TPA: chloride channel protein [Gemmatimonadaceae bacterium]|nr:chloride channel protein [Gemmatimonadaceae bacterium]